MEPTSAAEDRVATLSCASATAESSPGRSPSGRSAAICRACGAISVAAVSGATRETLINRTSLGYTLAGTVLFGALMGYIASIQQIVFDVFQRPGALAVVFAGVAIPMAAASFGNSRFVVRVGVKRMAHWALVAVTLVSALHLAVVLTMGESLAVFVVLQGLTMGCFGLASSNMNAIAMQPMGHIAGTATAVQGTVSTILAAIIGAAIGQSFDGSTVPLTAGFLLMSLVAVALIRWTEGRRMFAGDAN